MFSIRPTATSNSIIDMGYMNELANRDLVISDDSIDRLLSSLEKDKELEALQARRIKSSPKRVVPMSSSSNARSTPAYVSTTEANRKGHFSLGWYMVLLLVVAVVTYFVMTRNEVNMSTQDRGDASGSAAPAAALPPEDTTTEGVSVTSGSASEETGSRYLLQYDALYEYEADAVEDVAEMLGCSISCDGRKLKIDSEYSPEKLSSSLADYIDSLVTELPEIPEHVNIVSADANDTYSEFTITVSAVSLNAMEKAAVDRLFVPAAIYNNLTESDVTSIQVSFVNMHGDILSKIATLDS